MFKVLMVNIYIHNEQIENITLEINTVGAKISDCQWLEERREWGMTI